MTRLALLCVASGQLLDVGLYEVDFSEGLVSGRGPSERLDLHVPGADLFADLRDQDVGAGERATADRLASEDAEPGIDLVDPGRPEQG